MKRDGKVVSVLETMSPLRPHILHKLDLPDDFLDHQCNQCGFVVVFEAGRLSVMNVPESVICMVGWEFFP